MTTIEKKALRTAATVLLLREGDRGLEVFMVVRHHEIEFASGGLVFPGGSIDPGDRAVAEEAALLCKEDGLDPEAAVIRVAGIRETFEESGVLLARKRGAGEILSATQMEALAPQRIELHDGKVTFIDIIRKHQLVLATDGLTPFAHWITPVQRPKRFDTHFLLARAPRDQVGNHDGRESVDSLWLTPNDALEGAKTGRFKVPFPTTRNLARLGRFDTVDAAFAHARTTPVVTVTPELTIREDGGRTIKIPAAAGYDGEVFDF